MVSSSYPGDPSAPLPPHLDPRPRHRGRRRAGGAGRKSAVRISLALGTVVSVACLILAGYAWATYRNIDKGVPRGKVHVGASPTGGQADFDGKDQNILLVGIDDRSKMTDAEVRKLHVGRGDGSMATDTMMIVHVPADGSKATLISIPRDSYVKIPGYSMNKINAAYALAFNNASGAYDDKRTAGANLLLQTVSNLTGLSIDHYVQVNFMGFYDLAKALGGITVNLCHDVDDTVAYNQSHGQDGGSGFKMTKGKHKLGPIQSLEFVRQRHNLPGGDLDRTRRQQYFLTAAFRKVASVGVLFKLKDLGDAVKRNLFVDQGLHLTDLAQQMNNLSADKIIGKRIPFERFDDNSPVGSVEIIDPARVQRFVKKLIEGPTAASSSASASTPATKSTPAGSRTAPASNASSSPKAIDAKCIN
ncbi:MAG TPA: LCP family protein [Jatrophihabitans sp.]|nr:LCP family protein [Jatrophihabitans sp.]